MSIGAIFGIFCAMLYYLYKKYKEDDSASKAPPSSEQIDQTKESSMSENNLPVKSTPSNPIRERLKIALKQLGFCYIEEENGDVHIVYEGVHIISRPIEDEEFFSIVVPNIFERTDEKMVYPYTIADRINRDMKYVKAYFLGNSLWLSYERQIQSANDITEELVEMMINEAMRGFYYFHHLMKETPMAE